ncbi:uncharacterized protein LOC112557318 [Pomacea canaliculata]|uniref:uncharacterized protein LOC112557318 n=1 Tax=Pomacea canaliculata TaxID=400727 RepID=UPI000D72D0AE|nr:uncharacterized protein LOC112557318 [Pomacea canaliculata]
MFHFVVSMLLVCLLTFEVTDAKKNKNKTSYQKQIDNLRDEFEAFKNETSDDDKPYFGSYVQQGDWLLAFRLVAGNNQPGYDAYMDVNRNDDDLLVRALTPCSCLSINGTCNRQYRGSVLSLWTQLPILKVKLSLYEGGKEKAFAVFNGVGTTFTSWFTNDRLENSSWTDLKASSKNFFSIIGDDGLKRRLFINNAYPGCANDVGWLVVKDVEDTCTWGKSTSFPLILYSATGSKVVYQSTAVSKADSLAVWVSFKEPETFGESCF